MSRQSNDSLIEAGKRMADIVNALPTFSGPWELRNTWLALVACLFASFARSGSARATVKAFAAEGLTFPSRVQTGPNKGTLGWLPLRHHRVLQVLHNPRYAGAFAYGRRRARRAPDGTTRYLLQPRESWIVLI